MGHVHIVQKTYDGASSQSGCFAVTQEEHVKTGKDHARLKAYFDLQSPEENADKLVHNFLELTGGLLSNCSVAM